MIQFKGVNVPWKILGEYSTGTIILGEQVSVGGQQRWSLDGVRRR